jgi:hypothetical protein
MGAVVGATSIVRLEAAAATSAVLGARLGARAARVLGAVLGAAEADGDVAPAGSVPAVADGDASADLSTRPLIDRKSVV